MVYSNTHPLPLEQEPQQGINADASDKKKVKSFSHLPVLTQRMNSITQWLLIFLGFSLYKASWEFFFTIKKKIIRLLFD